jgi:tyrosyl-tRNA synthetase
MSPSREAVSEPSADRIHLPKLISDEFEISTSEARRLVIQGAVKVDGDPVLDLDPPASSLAGKTLTLGKRRSVEL